MTDDVQQFIESREKQFGGKITWRGFSLFYGDSDGNIREKGGLLMQVGDVFHFEDFEVKATFLGIPIEPKKKSDYVKFESSFDANDLKECVVVTKRNAQAYLHSRKPLRPVGRFIAFFSEVVVSVKLNGSRTLFFEFGDKTFLGKMQDYIK